MQTHPVLSEQKLLGRPRLKREQAIDRLDIVSIVMPVNMVLLRARSSSVDKIQSRLPNRGFDAILRTAPLLPAHRAGRVGMYYETKVAAAKMHKIWKGAAFLLHSHECQVMIVV